MVGVVGDVHDAELGSNPRPTVYLAHAQFPVTDLAIAVRSAGAIDPLSLTTSVRATLGRLDPDLPMDQVRSLERVAATSVAQPRFAMLLLSSFAAIALVLAAVGMYGVMAYVVSQRRHDIGIRMALGASRAVVVTEVVARAARPVGAGLVIGLAGAFLLSRTLSRLLYEIRPSDPLTYLVVGVTLAGVALLAAYLPALRASRVDPVFALRSE